jgi:hypothetical protein
MTDDKDQEFESTTRDFISIGKFIVTFSHIEFLIRYLLADRLKITNQKHFNAVIGPYDFAMLCTITTNILRQELPENKAEIDKVFSQCRALNDHRVRIAHGVWTYQSHGLMATHLSRHSLKEEPYYYNPRELERLTEKAEQLEREVTTSLPDFLLTNE